MLPWSSLAKVPVLALTLCMITTAGDDRRRRGLRQTRTFCGLAGRYVAPTWAARQGRRSTHPDPPHGTYDGSPITTTSSHKMAIAAAANGGFGLDRKLR